MEFIKSIIQSIMKALPSIGAFIAGVISQKFAEKNKIIKEQEDEIKKSSELASRLASDDNWSKRLRDKAKRKAKD